MRKCYPNNDNDIDFDVDVDVDVDIDIDDEDIDIDIDIDVDVENGNGNGQTHVHEVVGSVRLAEFGEDVHNHRFEGTTDEVIRVKGGHIHRLRTKTDTFEDHYHPIYVKTGKQVYLGEGEDRRHVHYIDSRTKIRDGHYHEFIDATLIENPIGDEKKKKRRNRSRSRSRY